MQRRDFFKRISLGTAAVVVAPAIVKGVVEELPKDQERIEVDRSGEDIKFRQSEFTPRYVDPQPGEWGFIYDLELEPEVWKEWHKAYGKGFQVFDWLQLPKT